MTAMVRKGDQVGFQWFYGVVFCVLDVFNGEIFVRVRIVGKGDETLVLQHKQSAGEVGAVVGDEYRAPRLVLVIVLFCDIVAVHAEGFIVYLLDGDEVCVVLRVEGVEVGGVLEIVRVQRAFV